MAQQASLFEVASESKVQPFKQGLLKWVGNKQKMAHLIIESFPESFGTYYEPFLGSGAVLGTLSPKSAFGSDSFGPLMEIWTTLSSDLNLLRS